MRRTRNLKRAGLAAIVAAIAALAIVAITAGGRSNTPRTASTLSTAAVTTPASTMPAAGSGPALTPAEYRKQANAICNALSLTPPAQHRLAAAGSPRDRSRRRQGEQRARTAARA